MTVAVIAPHPDDEVFGCGGTLLRLRDAGIPVQWVIVTGIEGLSAYSNELRRSRREAIEAVARRLRVAQVHELELPAAQLDNIPFGDIISKLAEVFRASEPQQVYVPFPGDAHTDHGIVFRAAAACTKWFRFPHVRRVLAYETLSETDFGIDPTQNQFRPNVFSDIGDHLDEKIELAHEYRTELGEFPFPRSENALRAQAALRGAQSGFRAAEAFMLLSERW